MFAGRHRVVPFTTSFVVANVTGWLVGARFVVKRVHYVEGGGVWAMDVAAVRLVRDKGIGPSGIAKRLGIGPASVCRTLSVELRASE